MELCLGLQTRLMDGKKPRPRETLWWNDSDNSVIRKPKLWKEWKQRQTNK